MIRFSHYKHIRNNYCVAYFGACTEYIVQLIYAKAFIEKSLPGICLYIACCDDIINLGNADTKLISRSELSNRVNDFAHIRELRCDMVNHPVYQFLDESNIEFDNTPPNPHDMTTRCVICPYGVLPTHSLSNTAIAIIEEIVTKKGFHPEVSNNIEHAGWVIGVENVPLFQAASLGIHTTLVESGLGTNLYKKMFPYGQTMHGLSFDE